MSESHQSDQSAPGDPAGSLGARQREEQAERLAIVDDERPRKKRRWRYVLGAVAAVILLVVVLLPQIAGMAAKGRIERTASEALGTNVRIENLGFSWFGAQDVGGLRLVDDSLREAADIDVRVDRSLVGLITGWRDLGTITISGSMTADMNGGPIVDIIEKERPPRTQPIRLPKGLSARVVFDDFDLRYVGTDGRDVAMNDLSGEIDFGVGREVTADLTSEIASAGEAPSSMTLDASVTSLTDSEGVLTPEKLGAQMALRTEGPESVLATFLNDELSLGASKLALDVTGTAQRAEVRMRHESEHAGADLGLRVREEQGGYRVELAERGTASVDADVIEQLAPAFGSLDDEGIAITDSRSAEVGQLPGVSLRLDELSMLLRAGSSIDLNALTARGAIETGAFAGTLGEEAWSVEPMALEFTTRGVRRGVSVQGATTAQLASQPAGAFITTLKMQDVWSESGAIVPDEIVDRLISGLTGVVEITGVETELVESLAGGALADSGVVLTEDMGESLDLEISLAEGEPKPIRAWLTSDNVLVGGSVTYEDGVIRSQGDGVRAEAETLAPLFSRVLGDRYAVDSGGESEVWVRNLALDTARLMNADDDEDEAEAGLDLRAVSGVLEMRVGPVQGRIVEESKERSFETTPAALTADLSDIASGASLAGSAALTVEGQNAGDVNISLRARDLVDAEGRLIAGVPTVDGEITARSVRSELGQTFAQRTGLTLSEDIGETFDLIARADVDAQDVVGVTGSVTAANLTGSATFEIRDRVLSAVEEGVSVELRRVGAAVGRMLSDRLNMGESGTLTFSSSDLVLAMGENGMDWSRARASASLAVQDVTFRDARDTRFAIERLDGELSIGQDQAMQLTINGVIERGEEPVLLAGQLLLSDLVEGERLTLESARLGGQIDIEGFPIAAATEALDMGEQNARTLTAELVGRLLNASLVADAETGDLLLTLSSDRLSGRAEGSLRDGLLRVASARLESVVDEAVIEQMRLRTAQARGQTEPLGGRFTEPARLLLTVGSFDVIQGGALALGGTPDIRLEVSGEIDGYTVERAEGPVAFGAIGLSPLVFEGRIPLEGVLGETQTTASLAVSGEAVSGDVALGSLVGGLDITYLSGKLAGPAQLDLKIEQIDTGQLDEVLVLEGLLAGALGAQADLNLVAEASFNEGTVGTMTASASVVSPRLWTETPVEIKVEEVLIRVAEPGMIVWKLEPEVLTRLVLRQPVGAERITATESVEARLRLDSLVVSRGTGLFEPGVFGIESKIDVTPLTVYVPDEVAGSEKGVTHVYEDIELSVSGDTSKIVLTANATPSDRPNNAITLEMDLREFAGEGGAPAFENATASAELIAEKAPSALIDALLRQGGLMAEVLGPDVTIDINATDLHAESGDLTIDVQAPRASGTFVGTMFEGRLIATQPAVMTVTTVRPELGSYVTRAVPVIGTVTKTADDGPAIITINTMEIPLVRDDQLSRLQQLWIEAVIDLGEARFDTSSVFSSVMKAAGQRTEGGLGRRMEPIELTLNSGNLIYPRTKIPIGEFTIESEGKFRLTDRYVDIVTYIPMAALSEEALGSLKTGFTSALGRQFPGLESATMVPWRTRGGPGDRSTKPDIQKLVENLGDSLNPLNLINQGLGSVQDLVIDRNNGKKQEEPASEPAPEQPDQDEAGSGAG